MAVKKAAAKKAANKMYAVSSSEEPDLGSPFDTLEEATDMLAEEWEWYDDEVVTVYELVPVKKYKKSNAFVEVK